MSTAAATSVPDQTSVVVERTFPHPVAKVWRALTESPLMAEWLMKNDFMPVVGRSFQLRAQPMPQWDGIVNGEVVAVEPMSKLSYRWDASFGLRTLVTFTLTPVKEGAHLRMEQSGFTPEQSNNWSGATYGWQKMIGALDGVLAKI